MTLGPYKDFGKITLSDVFKKYWIIILFNFATLVVLAWFLTDHIKLDRKIKTANKDLELEIKEKIKTAEALRESEEKYRTIFENTGTAGVIMEENMMISLANDQFADLSGYSRKEIEGQKKWIEFVVPEDLEKMKERHRTMRENRDTATKNYEFRFIDKNSHIKHIFLTVDMIPGTKKSVASLLDITERKQAEAEQKKLQAQLNQAQKMEAIGTLAGGIAHDFNNILSPIIGYAQMLLLDAPEDSPSRKGLNNINTSALRAQRLIQQILTFSRQGSSELILMKMQPIVKEALKLIRSTIPTTIEINQDLHPDCGVINADPTQIHQIVMNLATNAYHAMEETGGELKVSLKQVESGEYDIIIPDMTPGIYVCLTVADTGVGMDKNLTDKIFDPFFTTKEVGKGTGMGLSVVHGIVKGMGGSIHVYSEPGKGTQFNVYLPLAEAVKEQQVTNVEAPVQGGTEHILFVDDEELILQMETVLLERLGYQVTSRTSSIEALEAFRKNPAKFDMVITDMAMPNMSGDKLSVELIKIRPDIPVLLCTGFSENMSEEKAASMGIKGFLLKPIVIKSLDQKIREVLDEN